MSKPYDSVFKDLLERDPAGWVRLALGSVAGEPTLVDSDISTVSGAADKVVLLSGVEPSLIHFEAFASWDGTILARSLNYNGIFHRRHLLPVHTVLVVMRPEADHPSLTGEYCVVSPASGLIHLLQYQVIRAWKLDLEAVLHGSLATLPLAPITDGARPYLPDVLRQMEARLASEASPEVRKDLWMDAYVLLGLRYPRESVAQLFREVRVMRESDTYQMILEEGRVEEARRALLLVSTPRLGEPNPETLSRITAETDLVRLEEWLRRSGQVESWADLPGLAP